MNPASSMKQLGFTEDNVNIKEISENSEPIIDFIPDLDINNMSPLESLIKIQEIKENQQNR